MYMNIVIVNFRWPDGGTPERGGGPPLGQGHLGALAPAGLLLPVHICRPHRHPVGPAARLAPNHFCSRHSDTRLPVKKYSIWHRFYLIWIVVTLCTCLYFKQNVNRFSTEQCHRHGKLYLNTHIYYYTSAISNCFRSLVPKPVVILL